jgi:hypothetical protein
MRPANVLSMSCTILLSPLHATVAAPNPQSRGALFFQPGREFLSSTTRELH